MESPIDPFISQQGTLILDGGLASELEQRGCVLDSPLWSAQVLRTDPDAIKAVHRSYLEAGADCIIASSYQLSFAGGNQVGLTDREVEDLLDRAIRIACEARDEFWTSSQQENIINPIVAASIGPYGAYLADGSEYTGDYRADAGALYSFHARRFEWLSKSEADLLACETIPSLEEAKVLINLIAAHNKPAYLSFSCKDQHHINDNTPIRSLVDLVQGVDQIVAVGINCTAPEHVAGLIHELTDLAVPILVYPNSGETYDGHDRTWHGASSRIDFGQCAIDWNHKGANLIGGCCRTGPAEIAAIRKSLLAIDQ
jgi:homocysteine S-methyltransferase